MIDIINKNKHINRRFIILIIAVIVLLLLMVRCASARANALPRAETPADIISFLGTFGWQVQADPVSHKNVQIPARFNQVYEQYNALQKRQGFDLSRYRADIVDSYSFRILNHPAAGDVFANVLVFRGRIIGGDVCSYAIDGFMTTFDGLPGN